MSDTIDKGTYVFNIRNLEDIYLNDCPKDTIDYLCQDIVLRKLYRNIKRIYKVEQANRNQIIRQMITLLKEDVTKWIVRLDVKHFYESINRKSIVEKFKDDGRLSFGTISLLETLFANPAIAATNGLPRGLSVSSVMSELYMRYFDLELRRMDGVFFYARFVDDIIIFCSSQKAQQDVWNIVPVLLSNLGLQLNETKSYKWDSEEHKNELTYLGYSFYTKVNNDVDVAIAERKIKVIKTRITKSFVRFAKDCNYDLLRNRIKYLTGNFTLFNHSSLLPINVGLYFNYSLATNVSALYELDKYYQSMLHCRTGSLGCKLKLLLSDIQRKELSKYSFVFGYKRHVHHHFTYSMLVKITNCWQ